jgi:hypothetical protein
LIFSYVEIGLSIIAASIPALRVLVRDKINSTRGASKGTLPSQNTASRPRTQRKVDDLEELATNRIHRNVSITVEYGKNNAAKHSEFV